MCSKCDELDRKIEHYQRLSRMLLDQRVIEGLEALIEKYKADKKALHPESPCSDHDSIPSGGDQERADPS